MGRVKIALPTTGKMWATTEESLQPWKLQPPRLDAPAGGSLHGDDRVDRHIDQHECASHAIVTPLIALMPSTIRFRVIRCNWTGSPNMQGRSGAKSQRTMVNAQSPFVSINHVDIFPPKAPGNKIQNTESREARLEFSLCLVI
jgi:hypothetical protein